MQGSISYKNLKNRPGRTAALVLLSMFLSFAALFGSLFISGLRSGLDSLENRLGADIMVVPYEAASKSSLSDIILQGNPGYFYMDSSILDKISRMDGIGQISAQFYLASSTSSCCSVSVQIIGFDPETDFTVTPWVRHTYKDELGYMEVLVGNELNAFPGDILTFYGSDVKVASRLDRTGTYLDTAVYASEETIKTLIKSAIDKQIFDFTGVDPDNVISCIMINVAEGYTTEDVLNDINIHVRKVEAVQTRSFLSDISEKLQGISGLIGWLVAGIWILALAVLILVFVMIANERKKEFAILRAVGASRGKLSGILLKEGLMVSLLGSVIGALLAIALAFLLAGTIENSLKMPFLLPGAVKVLILALLSIAASVLAGSIAAAISAWKISRTDTAVILRGEN